MTSMKRFRNIGRAIVNHDQHIGSVTIMVSIVWFLLIDINQCFLDKRGWRYIEMNPGTRCWSLLYPIIGFELILFAWITICCQTLSFIRNLFIQRTWLANCWHRAMGSRCLSLSSKSFCTGNPNCFVGDAAGVPSNDNALTSLHALKSANWRAMAFRNKHAAPISRFGVYVKMETVVTEIENQAWPGLPCFRTPCLFGTCVPVNRNKYDFCSRTRKNCHQW